MLKVTQHNINHSFVEISLDNHNSSNLLWIPVTWLKRQTTVKNIKTLFLDFIWLKPSNHNEIYNIPYDNNIIINIQQAGKFQKTKFITFKYTYNNRLYYYIIII